MERKVTGTGRARPQLFPPFQELLPARLPEGADVQNQCIEEDCRTGAGRG